MEKHRTIQDIISLPKRFYSEEHVSFYSLLKLSGYFELYEQIGEADIFAALTQHLEYADQWLSWSENKRSSSGWYLKEIENGKYVVGYFPLHNDLKNTCDDKIEACSIFIKREIEDVRKMDHCRVCGLYIETLPWGEDGNSPTYEICPCCGVEFGYEDYTAESAKQYREKWIHEGANWFQPKQQPENWDRQQQSKNIPDNFL